MKIKELKTKSIDDLKIMLTDSRLKLRDLRFKNASSQLKDVRELREIKKNIAQILTLIKASANK